MHEIIHDYSYGSKTLLWGKPTNFKNSYNFQNVADEIWEHIGHVDALIQMEQPFKVVKEDKEKGKELIQTLVKKLHTIAKDLEPLMPDTSEKILEAIKANKKPDTLFARID